MHIVCSFAYLTNLTYLGIWQNDVLVSSFISSLPFWHIKISEDGFAIRPELRACKARGNHCCCIIAGYGWRQYPGMGRGWFELWTVWMFVQARTHPTMKQLEQTAVPTSSSMLSKQSSIFGSSRCCCIAAVRRNACNWPRGHHSPVHGNTVETLWVCWNDSGYGRVGALQAGGKDAHLLGSASRPRRLTVSHFANILNRLICCILHI